MGDYAELLMSEQSNPSAALMQILVSDYTQYDRIAAVEGDEDKIFYFDFLRFYLPGKSILYLACGGKPAVLGLKKLVEEYDWAEKPSIAYLCDKDFDDYIGTVQPDVFYTCGYSIESYFASRAYASYVLEKYSSGTLTVGQRSAIEADFEEILLAMVEQLRTIAALMIELRAERSHPDFSLLSINDLFDLARSPPTRRRDRWARVRAAWCREAEIPLGRIVARARRLRTEDYALWLRGKLGLQLARTAFRLAVIRAPEGVRAKAPDAALFGADSFRSARQFINDLPTLREHCAALQ